MFKFYIERAWSGIHNFPRKLSVWKKKKNISFSYGAFQICVNSDNIILQVFGDALQRSTCKHTEQKSCKRRFSVSEWVVQYHSRQRKNPMFRYFNLLYQIFINKHLQSWLEYEWSVRFTDFTKENLQRRFTHQTFKNSK